MDVDANAVRGPQMSKEEREKLFKEKRCFFCKKEGHRARECPDKRPKRGSGKGKSEHNTKTARVVDKEDQEEPEPGDAPPAYKDLPTFLHQVRAMKPEDREELMDTLASQDFA